MSASQQLNIHIDGIGPYGFRLFGGNEEPLVVAKLRKRSKADDAGLNEGDILLSINHHKCQNMNYNTAMNLIENAGHFLDLNVLRGQTNHQTINAAYGTQDQQPRTQELQGQGRRGQGRQRQSASPNPMTTYETTVARHLVNGSPSAHLKQYEFHINNSKMQTDLGMEHDEGTVSTKFENNEHFQTNIQLPISAKSTQQWSPQTFQIPTPVVEPSKPSPNNWAPVFRAPEPAATGAKKISTWSPSQPVTPLPKQNNEENSRTKPVSFKENVEPSFLENNNQQFRPQPIQQQQFTKKSFAPEPLQNSWLAWQPSSNNSSQFPPKQQGYGFGENFNSFNAENGFESSKGPPTAGLPKDIERILSGSAVNSDVEANINSPSQINKKKKMFADSSFYSDPQHKYPTIEEQIKMARKVALSLTAPVNVAARGHRMFMKRKEKSDKWTADFQRAEQSMFHESDSDDLYYNPTPWSGAKSWKAPTGKGAKMDFSGSAPLNAPYFAAKLPTGSKKDEGSKNALSAEEFEHMRLYDQKTTHDSINPQVCFNLANDMKMAKGKGGKLFAKRKARSEQWIVEDKDFADSKPNLAIMSKLSNQFEPTTPKIRQTAPTTPTPKPAEDLSEYSLTPTNRLKGMIEMPKAKMTPWDAVAEYGNVDVAFEHLKDFRFAPPPKSTSNSGRFSTTSGASMAFAGQNNSNNASLPFMTPAASAKTSNTFNGGSFNSNTTSPQTTGNFSTGPSRFSSTGFAAKPSAGGYRQVKANVPVGNFSGFSNF